MDIAGKIAELLCNAFLWYCTPERHKEWIFNRGIDMVRITISVERPKGYKNVTEVKWVVPEPEVSMS
jgi:hypothetical protein